MRKYERFTYALLIMALLCLFAPASLAEAVLTLPEGLAVIEEETFYGAQALGEVVLPEGVEEIRSRAFAGSSLEAINLPESISFIADDAFDGCAGMSVAAQEGSYAYEWAVGKGYIEGSEPQPTNPEDFTYSAIDDETCAVTGYTGSEKEIMIPSVSPEGLRVVEIGDYAFEGHTAFTAIELPDTLETIGVWAFSGCSGLLGVDIPESVTTIGEYVFSYCSSLLACSIPEQLITMPSHAFYGCTSLKRIVLSENLKYIYDFAFASCESLAEVILPSGLEIIGSGAFWECKSIVSIEVPERIRSLEGVFGYCIKLKNVILPEGMSVIEDNTFAGCTSLECIQLPDSITYLCHDAFKGCDSLKEVNYPKQWMYTGYAYQSSFTPFSSCSALTSISIPEGVKAIPQNAFRECTSLLKVFIPRSVVEIGGYSFYGCSDELAIYGFPGSYAEEYAEVNGIRFISVTGPTVTLEMQATGSSVGDKVLITVTAADGASPYKYSFALYRDGEVIRRNTGSQSNKCSFVIREAGVLYSKDGYEFRNDRYEFVAVCGNNAFARITGTSLGHGPLYLSAKGLHHWKESNSQTVTVFAPTDWLAVTESQWLTIVQNENLLTVSMTENTTGKVRNGEITVTSGEYQVTLEVVQEEGETLALRDLVSDKSGALSKKEAADILNFIGGKKSVQWYLFVGYKPHADLEDYWRLLIGDTKGWSDAQIEITGKSFVNWAKVRLTFYASFASSEEMDIRVNELVQYASEKTDVDNILKDGAEDFMKELTGTDNLDWLNAEDVRAVIGSYGTLASLSRASESAYVLNKMVQKSDASRYDKMLSNAEMMWNTSVCWKIPSKLDFYAETILQYK